MTRTRFYWIIGLVILLICLISLNIRLISAMQDKKAAHGEQAETAKIYSLPPAQLKLKITSLKKQLDSLPVKIQPSSEKNTWIAELSSKAAAYKLDLVSLTPSESSISSGLEKQTIAIDLLGAYKNTLFFFDDLITAGHALTIQSINMRCERAGEPVKTHAEIHLTWSAE